MSRRKKLEFKKKTNSSFSLNLTSMCDMFTIMLVFLLQNFAITQVQVETLPGLRLPSSNSERNLTESVKIAVSREVVKFEDRTIADIKNNDFEAKDIDPNDSNFIVPLFNELDKLAKSSDKTWVKEGKLLLQADEELPYNTIRKVMYTASMAGFPQLKLVTIVGK